MEKKGVLELAMIKSLKNQFKDAVMSWINMFKGIKYDMSMRKGNKKGD
jgi:hypothetical protein